MSHPDEMDYPAQGEVLGADPIFEWIDRHYLRRDPYAFSQVDFQEFAIQCSKEFELAPNGIYCVGSGAIGLSLNPGKMTSGMLKRFGETSDLDIALVSEVHFETAWRNLRERCHPALNEMENELAKAMNWQRKRFFDGAILANVLLPQLDFGPDWIRARVRIAQYVSESLGREIKMNFWIFRDYWSVRSYVANGIIRCKGNLE